MTFKAYLDTVKAKTGKTPDDFRELARKKGLTTSREIRAWLKEEFGLGQGHAQAIVHMLESAAAPKTTKADAIAAHFAGKKDVWRKPYEALLAKVNRLGPEELGLLAKRLAAASNPVEAARIRERLTRGFYGI